MYLTIVCCDLSLVSSEGHLIKLLLTSNVVICLSDMARRPSLTRLSCFFVQPPVYQISPHSWLTSGTSWWSGVPGRERLTKQHPLKITSQQSACETSWVNMPLPLEYQNLQATISIKILLYETVSYKKYFATFKLIWFINVKWIHEPLYVEIKAVFLYINSTPANRGLFH